MHGINMAVHSTGSIFSSNTAGTQGAALYLELPAASVPLGQVSLLYLLGLSNMCCSNMGCFPAARLHTTWLPFCHQFCLQQATVLPSCQIKLVALTLRAGFLQCNFLNAGLMQLHSQCGRPTWRGSVFAGRCGVWGCGAGHAFPLPAKHCRQSVIPRHVRSCQHAMHPVIRQIHVNY